MTIMKQRLLLVLLVALLPLLANAYDVKIDGIYYNLVTKANMAEVTYGDDKYSGDIIIPKTVEHEGVKYDVITIGKDAFQYAQLSSITIPNSIKTIGENSFYYYFSSVEEFGTIIGMYLFGISRISKCKNL